MEVGWLLALPLRGAGTRRVEDCVGRDIAPLCETDNHGELASMFVIQRLIDRVQLCLLTICSKRSLGVIVIIVTSYLYLKREFTQ